VKYDYIIIGAGLFGSIFAHELNKHGKKVVVIDKRPHIGGNCFTEKFEDYHIHKYGPHIFHTSQKYIWDYINQFTEFTNYSHRVKANSNGQIYSLPINLLTINQIWPNIITPEQAKSKISQELIPCYNPKNLEDHILSMVGPTIYEKLIKGYTSKHWGKDPKDLPTSIIKRLPIRYTFNDRYYHDNDIYEGLPIDGYTPIFQKMLKGIEVHLGIDYFKDRSYWDSKAKKIIFSGQIDQYFDYMFGDLEYRTLDFKNIIAGHDIQGVSQMNYPDSNIPWTRVIQHKYFTSSKSSKDYVTYESSRSYNKLSEKDEPYYPMNDENNNQIYYKYRSFLDKQCNNIIIGGRLGNYRYYDMDMTIGNALSNVKKELAGI
jgi:UDP-galactopyranose mutase